MRTLAHISDLHFGCDVPDVSRGLVESLSDTRPDLLVVSGDLTQRATSRQFRDARNFLARIPFPSLVVPGNHDVSLFNVFRRFLLPLKRYQEYITKDLAPFFYDNEIAVLGINTARSFTWKNGRISTEQMDTIRERFCPINEGRFKILVTHHPFIAPPGDEGGEAVGRAERVLSTVDGCNPDIALAGHFHMSYFERTHMVYTSQKGSILVIQAGTAVSRRTRGEKNAYNIIQIDKGVVELTVYAWNGLRFREHHRKQFRRSNGLWEKLSEHSA